MNPSNRPDTVDDFMVQLDAARQRLPKRLLQCADFVSENSDRIALSTVADLSAEAGVSPSAMMRFAQALGFEGFSDMQRLFRNTIRRELPDYATRLTHLRQTGAGSPSALLAEFVDAGRSSLEALASSVDPRVLDQSVAQLAEANMIHIKGVRRAFPVAAYMAYAFEKMLISSVLHDGAGKLGYAHVLQDGDAAIAVTFAPYSPETLDFIREASGRGLSVVVITDKRQAIPSGESVFPILVSEVDFGAFRSLSATLTVAISLAVAVGAKRNATK